MASTATTNTNEIIHLNAPTHFPIKLTTTNFSVWRRQVHATLVGLNLLGYVDGSIKEPAKFTDSAQTVTNSNYLIWYRQDQIIVSALLGSCTDSIQPLISSATTAHDAWQRLVAGYASASRGRIISLKAKLARNPRGSRSITSYINDMRAIADDLALAQCPVSDEDLMVYILTQLGEEYNSIISAVRIRETPISLGELSSVLTDHERQLKDADDSRQSLLANANVTQRTSSPRTNRQSNSNRNARANTTHYGANRSNWQQGGTNRPPVICKFCNFAGHETKVCRKLARFLKEYNVLTAQTSASPTAHSAQASPPWLFDSGASHHATSSLTPLQTLSEYNGPDEVRLGDGNSLQISHIGRSVIPTPSSVLTLENVLHVPQLHTNLVSISQLCKTNRVSVEFFGSHFLVKDLRTGTSLLRGVNDNGVYYGPVASHPTIHATQLSCLSQWHHQLGHPSNKVLQLVLQRCNVPVSVSSMRQFYCSSCNNFSGTVELNMFSNLKTIWYLSLSHNRLSLFTNTKTNSTSWSENLFFLMLSSCNLTNLNFLRDSKSLEYLDLSNNKIQGRIPEWAWSNWQDTMWYLNLSHNYLTSVEGIQLHSIETIDLQFNLLEGPLPIPSSPVLRYYFASQNKLSGEMPFTVCNLSNVHILDLANNSLSGAIPQCLGNSSKLLEVLDLHNNEFRGSIPSTFSTGNQLHTLNLRGNKLEGIIPRSLASCINLVVLDLGENNLSYIFPDWLLTLPKLQVLSLRSNHFYGTITTSPTKHLSSQLKIIDLSHNDFTGNLPVLLFKSFTAMKNTDEDRKPRSYFGDESDYYYKDSLVLVWKGWEHDFEKILTILTTIDLSSNKFDGNIPGAIGQLLPLRSLNLSHNMLCGYIPRSFGKLSFLESLDISSNQLVGEIPKELAPLTFLSVFKLSHNSLTGCIPKGNQFNTFEKSSYEGNDGLRGYPMTKDCGNGVSSQPPTLEVLHQEDNVSILYGFTWKVVLLGYGCGIVFGMVMGSLMLLTRKPYWITRIVEEEGYKIMRKGKRKRSKIPRSGRRS